MQYCNAPVGALARTQGPLPRAIFGSLQPAQDRQTIPQPLRTVQIFSIWTMAERDPILI
jgi:hypothetical protein